jgi:hypothetical protein
MEYVSIDPEVVHAVFQALEDYPNYSDRPKAILDILRPDFPWLSLPEVRAAMRALAE